MRWPLRMLASALLVLASAAPMACDMPSHMLPTDLAVQARSPFPSAAWRPLAPLAAPAFAQSLLGDGLSPQDGASIALEKLTNGQDADLPPGPLVAVGDSVVWSYLVTSTGTIALASIQFVDDQDVSINCPRWDLLAGEAMECAATLPAALVGQQSDAATVYGTPEDGSPTVSASDPSHYFGVAASIALDKLSLGMDADSPPGPYVVSGEAVTWSYLVTNTGNITLTNVVVADDQGISVTCPGPTLASGEAMVCEASGTAVAGQYANLATVEGNPPAGLVPASASDPSHYYGVAASFALAKYTNGHDVDAPPGPFALVGEMVTWSYRVTNTGNITLTQIVVTDDQGVDVVCPQEVLASDEAMVCTGTDAAILGPYSNLATVTGLPPMGPVASATDRSYYRGVLVLYELDLPLILR